MRVLLPAFAVALAIGCTPRLDHEKLETDIQTGMAAKGVALTEMSCPSVRLSKGTVFQCTGLDSNGTHAVFDVTASGDAKGNVTWKLHGKFENMAVVGDRLETSLSARMGKPVDVTCPSKNIVIQQGVTFVCSAKVGDKTMNFVFTARSDQGDWETKVEGG